MIPDNLRPDGVSTIKAKAEVLRPRLLRKRFYADVFAWRTGKRIALSDFVLIPSLS
jgi:hypothetical protein